MHPDDPLDASAPADPAPSGLREAKKARTRADLARAALLLAAEEGLHGTTVEAIAARAGVSPRTFFNYFDSKDEAVVHLGADRFRRLMSTLFDGPRADARGTRVNDDVVVVPSPSADPILRIRDAMLDFLRDSDADADASADDDLMKAALERNQSLYGTLHATMTAVGAEFEAALTTRYADEAERDRARVGLSVALGLTQTAMQSARAGRTVTPMADQVAHYFGLLHSAFASPATTEAHPTEEGPTTS